MATKDLVERKETSLTERVKTLSLKTRHTERYIERFIQTTGLPVEKALVALEISAQYGAQPKKVAKFLQADWSVDATEEAVQALQEYNTDQPMWRVRELAGYVSVDPNLEQYVSYDALIFIDEMTGSSHDLGIIEKTLEAIEQRLEHNDAYASLGPFIHRMREIYDDGQCGACIDSLVDRALYGRFKR